MKYKLQQYAEIDLDSVFRKFYDTMLSNKDFSGFFKNEEQIKSLLVRQKKFLLESIVMTDEEIKSRYIALGEMHHQIQIPYIDYMAGLNILERGMIEAVATHEQSNELIELTFNFFQLIRSFTAKGYLNKMLDADIVDIDNYLAHVQRATELDTILMTERVIWLKNIIFAIKIENRAAAPSLHMPDEIINIISSVAVSDPSLITYTKEIACQMEMNARNVFYFVEHRSYAEALPLYRELMSIYKFTLMLTNVVTIASTNRLVQDLTKDPLTGLLTRHAISSILSRELTIATAGQYELTFIMVDIDHFKQVNDNYGHGAGDQVLKDVARVFAHTIRATDFAFRMGGEEFLLVLKGASQVVALVQAELIRQHVENLVFSFEGQDLRVTASFGLAVFAAPFKLSHQEMIDAADRKLYAAKEGGRNRVNS